MIIKRQLLLIIVLAWVLPGQASTQKIGHVNYNQLLLNAPGIKAIDAELKAFQDSLNAIYTLREKELEDKYRPLDEQAKQGLLAPRDLAQIQREYQTELGNLNAYGQGLSNKIYERRQTLLDPLIMKIEQAIQKVAKEGGYLFVFDSSLAGQSWFNESDNLYEEIIEAMK